MRKILIIGIGAGDPEHMTLQAIAAMRKANVVFMPDKGEAKVALRDARVQICERFLDPTGYRIDRIIMPVRADAARDYEGVVADWHRAITMLYADAVRRMGEDETAAILVWGDPALYDSTLRIVETMRADGLAFEHDVIPGISSVQALAAKHRIALNRIGQPIMITTGRRLAAGFPPDADTVVVMLDGEQSFAHLDDPDLEIFWGAYLGTVLEMLVAGRLADVKDEIAAKREAGRRDNGWIMDIYLLRRPSSILTVSPRLAGSV